MRRVMSITSMILLVAACAAVGGGGAERPSFWAFTGPWDATSTASLGRNAAQLDVAVTGWIGLDSATGRPLLPSAYPDTVRLTGRTPERFALVTSWHGLGFHATPIRVLGSSPTRLAEAAGR